MILTLKPDEFSLLSVSVLGRVSGPDLVTLELALLLVPPAKTAEFPPPELG